jgi:hypothetical protein
MTSAPDPAHLPEPGLPKDPALYGLRRRGLGAAVWVLIAFTFLCAISGLAIARFGPQWFPAKAPATAATAPAPANAPGPAVSPAPTAPAAPGPAASPIQTPPAPTAELAALSSRLDKVQADQRRESLAAGEALAASALTEAAQSSGRFDEQLAGLDALLPDTSDLRALRALAETGAPSRAALATEFAAVADRVAVAAKTPPPGASLMARIVHALSSVFTVRRIDQLSGDSPDAILARAQRRVDDGDLEGALKDLDTLPQTGRDAVAGWRARAARRVQIDHLVAAIRQAAVRDLAAARGAGA